MLTALLVLASASAAPVSMSCAAAERGATVAVQPGLSLSLKLQASQLTVHFAGRTSVLSTFPCRQGLEQEFVPVILQDLNFDGLSDLAVLDGIGYGGVNVYYRLYYVDKANQTLRASQLDPVEMSQLTADPLSRTLQYSHKSGPGYRVMTLCPLPLEKDFFVCRATDLNPKAQFADDWDYTWYDSQGRPVFTHPARIGTDSRPELFTVVRKTFFAPAPGAKVGRSYVIAGDQVEVLELRSEWAYAKFKNGQGRATVGWLLRRDLRP
ncbi:hypothetical protein GO986_20750 [Deinococcus sp. HMF7620]|uniref:SH3b domain-containing protein n=1 Tax=Deinococcus arboris TaxID=2682977 RepID=A0A7C9HU77_9DEIO|nr:hypothetical protein [Deinococcus arboris]MVN89169.1 hypothetical protein [Deinococcus arboris]